MVEELKDEVALATLNSLDNLPTASTASTMSEESEPKRKYKTLKKDEKTKLVSFSCSGTCSWQ